MHLLICLLINLEKNIQLFKILYFLLIAIKSMIFLKKFNQSLKNYKN